MTSSRAITWGRKKQTCNKPIGKADNVVYYYGSTPQGFRMIEMKGNGLDHTGDCIRCLQKLEYCTKRISHMCSGSERKRITRFKKENGGGRKYPHELNNKDQDS